LPWSKEVPKHCNSVFHSLYSHTQHHFPWQYSPILHQRSPFGLSTNPVHFLYRTSLPMVVLPYPVTFFGTRQPTAQQELPQLVEQCLKEPFQLVLHHQALWSPLSMTEPQRLGRSLRVRRRLAVSEGEALCMLGRSASLPSFSSSPSVADRSIHHTLDTASMTGSNAYHPSLHTLDTASMTGSNAYHPSSTPWTQPP
jgi:hypothetical protein